MGRIKGTSQADKHDLFKRKGGVDDVEKRGVNEGSDSGRSEGSGSSYIFP